MVKIPIAILLYLLPMYHFWDAYEVFNENPAARVVHVICWPLIEAVSWALFVASLVSSDNE